MGLYDEFKSFEGIFSSLHQLTESRTREGVLETLRTQRATYDKIIEYLEKHPELDFEAIRGDFDHLYRDDMNRVLDEVCEDTEKAIANGDLEGSVEGM